MKAQKVAVISPASAEILKDNESYLHNKPACIN